MNKSLQDVIVIDDEDESDYGMHSKQKLPQPFFIGAKAIKVKKLIKPDNKVRNPVRRRKEKIVRAVIRQVALKPKPPVQATSNNNDVNQSVNQVTPSVNQNSILKSVLLNEPANYQTVPVLLNTVTSTQPTANNLTPTTLIFNNQPAYDSQEMQMMTPKNFLVHNEGPNLLQNAMKAENSVVFMTSNQNSGGILTNMTSSLVSIKEENGKQNCMLPISPKNVVLRSYLMNNDVNYQNLSCGQTLSANESMVNSGFPVLNTVMTSQPLILNNSTINGGIQTNMSQPSQIVVVSNIQPVAGNMQLISQPQAPSNVSVLQNPNFVSPVQSNYQILTQPQTVNIINLSQVPNNNDIVAQNLNNSIGQLNTVQTPTIIYTQPQCGNNTPSQNIVNLHTFQSQINSVPSSQIQQLSYIQNTNNSMQQISNPNNSMQQISNRLRELKPNIKPDSLIQQNVAVNNPISDGMINQKIVETANSIHFKKVKQKSTPYTKRGQWKTASKHTSLNKAKTVKTRGKRKGDIDWNEVSSSNIIVGKRPKRKVREKINPLRVIEFSESEEETQEIKQEEKQTKEEEKQVKELEEIQCVKLEVKEEVQEEELEWESMVIIENDIECS